MTSLQEMVVLIGRVLLAAIFVVSGWGKIADITTTSAYIASSGLPPALAWPVAFFEVIAGLFIAIGFFTRWTALALTGFCLFTAFLFHTNWLEPMQQINFLKNLTMAGGFLILFAHPESRYSIETIWAGNDEEEPVTA